MKKNKNYVSIGEKNFIIAVLPHHDEDCFEIVPSINFKMHGKKNEIFSNIEQRIEFEENIKEVCKDSNMEFDGSYSVMMIPPALLEEMNEVDDKFMFLNPDLDIEDKLMEDSIFSDESNFDMVEEDENGEKVVKVDDEDIFFDFVYMYSSKLFRHLNSLIHEDFRDPEGWAYLKSSNMKISSGVAIEEYSFKFWGKDVYMNRVMKEKVLPDDGLLLSNDLLKGDFNKNDNDDKNS